MTLPRNTKLEDELQILADPAPLVVWDFNVAVFHVINWLEKLHTDWSPEVHKKMVRAAFALHINRGPSMMKMFPHRAIFVADYRFKHTSNYWRDDVMTASPVVQQAWVDHAEAKGVDYATLPKNYKGTRGEKTEEFFSVYNECKDYATKYFPFLEEEGYEADDLAGSVYRLSRDSGKKTVIRNRQIFLATVDRDWSQLVDEEHQVYFANTRIPGPNEKIQERLVGNLGVIEHTAHRMKFDISHPKDLAEHKVLHSDMGDNLPKGTPIELFDLCEPHPEFNIDSTKTFQQLKTQCAIKLVNNLPEHFQKSLVAFAAVGVEAPTLL